MNKTVTLLVTAAGFVSKAKRAKGSTDILDHADVIAGFVALVVAVVRAGRGQRSAERTNGD